MEQRKKYKLTDEFITTGRTKLYRIQALIDFGDVSAGDLGGYIEKEENLDHNGNAWVSGNARVRSQARISSPKDIFLASYVGTENGTLTVFKGESGLIATRGCFGGTVEEFLAKSKEVHNEKTHKEYQLLMEVAKSRILG